MGHTSTARTRTVVAFAVALVMTACSLIVNKKKDQCSADADCASTRDAVCLEGVCVLPGATDGGGDAAGDGSIVPDADGACAPKVPVSQEDFLNEKCTAAQCIDFDNCARLGLCPGVDGGDGGVPPRVDPPAGGI